MIEPSVGFQYPDDAAELAAATESARMAGRGEAWRLAVDTIAAARNVPLRLAVLRYLDNPQAATIGELTRQVGVSRATFNRELRALRSLRVLRA